MAALTVPGPSALGVDVLVVSVDSTGGWTGAARELVDAFSRAGAEVRGVSTGPVPHVRTFALTDLVQARLARQACLRGVAEHRPKAIVYCSITAALLWPVPGAIWLDALAAENRPGRHGVWQRIVERRRLAQAPLVLTMSPRSLEPLRGTGTRPEAVVVPSPIEPSAAVLTPAQDRDVSVLTYAGNPAKKRLDFILSAWERARRDRETLVVAGTDRGETGDGVQMAGRLDPQEYRALLRRARVFLAAPTREDYGIAPLEALADGCLLVTTPAPGPYPALDLARELDPRLVDEDIGRAVRIALEDPLPGYAERARELLRPFGAAAVDRTLADRVLPRLVPGFKAA